jgi:hypothetical protein
MAQSQLDEALKAYAVSLAIARRLAKVDPSNAGWQSNLSIAYVKAGTVLEAQGDLSAALKATLPLAITRSPRFSLDKATWCRPSTHSAKDEQSLRSSRSNPRRMLNWPMISLFSTPRSQSWRKPTLPRRMPRRPNRPRNNAQGNPSNEELGA